MANNPWDQVILNVRERPLSTDMNQQWSQSARSLREMLKYLLGVRTAAANPTLTAGEGFLGDSFRVGPESPASMNIVVRAGYGFQNNNSDVPVAISSITGLDDRSSYKPLVLNAAQTIAVPAADPTNPRIDIVEVAYDRYVTDSLSRDVLDTGTGQFVATLVNKTLAFLQDGRTSVNGAAKINYKTGTPAGSPAAPSTTAGYIKIAEVRVDALATSIAENKIKDLRKVLSEGGRGHRVSGLISLAMTGSPPTVTIWHLIAPPGFNIAILPGYAGAGNTRYAKVYIVGGNISQASCRAVATVTSGLDYLNNTLIRSCEVGTEVGAVDSAIQTWLAAASVPGAVVAAIGQPYAAAVLSPKQYDGTTVAQPTTGTMEIDFCIDFTT